jgi:hypothetical protein
VCTCVVVRAHLCLSLVWVSFEACAEDGVGVGMGRCASKSGERARSARAMTSGPGDSCPRDADQLQATVV